MANFFLLHASLIKVADDAPQMTEDDERWSKCRPLKIVVDESVAIEAPHLLRVILHLAECESSRDRQTRQILDRNRYTINT